MAISRTIQRTIPKNARFFWANAFEPTIGDSKCREGLDNGRAFAMCACSARHGRQFVKPRIQVFGVANTTSTTEVNQGIRAGPGIVQEVFSERYRLGVSIAANRNGLRRRANRHRISNRTNGPIVPWRNMLSFGKCSELHHTLKIGQITGTKIQFALLKLIREMGGFPLNAAISLDLVTLAKPCGCWCMCVS